jgi:hypothetical protein
MIYTFSNFAYDRCISRYFTSSDGCGHCPLHGVRTSFLLLLLLFSSFSSASSFSHELLVTLETPRQGEKKRKKSPQHLLNFSARLSFRNDTSVITSACVFMTAAYTTTLFITTIFSGKKHEYVFSVP